MLKVLLKIFSQYCESFLIDTYDASAFSLYSYSYSGNHSRLTTYYNSSRHVVLTGEITEQMAWLKFLFFPEHHNFLFYFGRHFMLLGKYPTADRIAGTFRTRRIRHALPETIYRYMRTLLGKRVGKESEGRKKKKNKKDRTR